MYVCMYVYTFIRMHSKGLLCQYVYFCTNKSRIIAEVEVRKIP